MLRVERFYHIFKRPLTLGSVPFSQVWKIHGVSHFKKFYKQKSRQRDPEHL